MLRKPGTDGAARDGGIDTRPRAAQSAVVAAKVKDTVERAVEKVKNA
jgi:hypothetical protein